MNEGKKGTYSDLIHQLIISKHPYSLTNIKYKKNAYHKVTGMNWTFVVQIFLLCGEESGVLNN